MRADNVIVANGDSPRDAARMAFRAEISDALSGIVDRDLFLQRIARRVAQVTGNSSVAIYTRSNGTGDLLLRSSTAPSAQRIPTRVGDPYGLGTAHLVSRFDNRSDGPRQLISVPIGSEADAVGALVLYSDAGSITRRVDPELLAGIADEIAPAVAVAEHHHAVKQASVVELTTGVYANWYLIQRFEEEVSRARRTASPLTAILVTILDFEAVQAELGFARCDMLLRELATEYAGLTRVFDIVGVRSRSEFAVLLPDTDPQAATTVIARIHRRSQHVIHYLGVDSSACPVRVVTGAGSFPDDGDQVAAVLMAAEHRLNRNEVLQRRLIERERR